MPLSETETPNGGWQFRDPAYGFVLERPDSVSLTLKQAVERVIACRLKNSAITAAQNRSTDFEQVKQELMNFTRARLGLPADDSPPVPKWIPVGRVARPAGIISNATAGLKVMAAWLGDGLTPVTNDLAERRANTCALQRRVDEKGNVTSVGCPQNQKPSAMQKLEGMAAQQFKSLIAVKNDLKLKTSLDDKLLTCQACDCDLTVKIWSPIKHILKHTSGSVREKLDKACWILAEEKSP